MTPHSSSDRRRRRHGRSTRSPRPGTPSTPPAMTTTNTHSNPESCAARPRSTSTGDSCRASIPTTWSTGAASSRKWGPGGKARYLDALLRDGSTPWAIEMKVQGGAGVGQYYRHAVAQAVLYREFIRRAEPLHPWFEKRGLVATDCRAAVVVPTIPSQQARWRHRLMALCRVFDVAFVEVDPLHARRH